MRPFCINVDGLFRFISKSTIFLSINLYKQELNILLNFRRLHLRPSIFIIKIFMKNKNNKNYQSFFFVTW